MSRVHTVFSFHLKCFKSFWVINFSRNYYQHLTKCLIHSLFKKSISINILPTPKQLKKLNLTLHQQLSFSCLQPWKALQSVELFQCALCPGLPTNASPSQDTGWTETSRLFQSRIVSVLDHSSYFFRPISSSNTHQKPEIQNLVCHRNLVYNFMNIQMGTPYPTFAHEKMLTQFIAPNSLRYCTFWSWAASAPVVPFGGKMFSVNSHALRWCKEEPVGTWWCESATRTIM